MSTNALIRILVVSTVVLLPVAVILWTAQHQAGRKRRGE
jgi:hypothetical protein